MASDPLGILLLSGSHDRVHYAFLLGAGAAAIGRQVRIFASNAGCSALLADISGLASDPRDVRARAAGVAGIVELREACVELGVGLMVCEAGLRMESLERGGLLDGVQVAGVATFLSDVGHGQIVSL